MELIEGLKCNIVRVSVLFLFVIWLSELQAQQAVLNANNDVTGSAGTVSYSVGQVAYICNTGTNGFIIEGVQQPFEIQFHEGIEDPDGMSLECILYPNPASSYINLKIERQDIKNLSYQLYNMNGFLLQTEKIESHEVSIRMEDFAAATYSLTVSENNRALRSFIIIKK
jgi:hypothetical protein